MDLTMLTKFVLLLFCM